jgi:hypothetical protein
LLENGYWWFLCNNDKTKLNSFSNKILHNQLNFDWFDSFTFIMHFFSSIVSFFPFIHWTLFIHSYHWLFGCFVLCCVVLCCIVLYCVKTTDSRKHCWKIWSLHVFRIHESHGNCGSSWHEKCKMDLWWVSLFLF